MAATTALQKITTRAKAIHKAHPAKKWTDCIKAASAELRKPGTAKPVKKVSGGVKLVPAKNTTTNSTSTSTAARKVKIKVRKAKNGDTVIKLGKPNPAASKTWGHDKMMDASKKAGLRLTRGYETEARSYMDGISGISTAKIDAEIKHQHGLQEAIDKLTAATKVKGLKLAEKAVIRRDIAKYKNALLSSKKHVTALKRSI